MIYSAARLIAISPLDFNLSKLVIKVKLSVNLDLIFLLKWIIAANEPTIPSA